MILRALLVMVFCGSGAFGYAFFNKKIEQLLPAYCLSIVLILFVFGLFNAMLAGWRLVFAAIIVAYIASVIKVFRIANQESTRAAIDSLKSLFFAPGFFVFLILLFVLMLCNGGVMSTGWDEFSHWGLIVKQMADYNVLSFNRIYDGELFRSYPPGVALFQYFCQKIAAISKAGYTEWLNYFSLQLLGYSFFAPVLCGFNLKKSDSWFCLLIAFFCPLAVFNNSVYDLGVDCLIGIASAAGLAYLFLEQDDNSTLRDITVLLDIAFLVLIKDAGVFFAAILTIAFILKRKKWLAPLACVFIPKFLWWLVLCINEVPETFGDAVEIKTLLNLLMGRDSSYRMGIWKNYWQVLFRSEAIHFLSVGIPLLIVLLLFVSMLFFLGKSKQLGILCIIQAALYYFGLAIVYSFKFSEYEADKLASLQRYIDIFVNELWVLLIIVAIYWIKRNSLKEQAGMIPCIVLCVALSMCSMDNIMSFFFKNNMYYSKQVREPYDSLFECVDCQIEDGSRIYFVCPDSSGYEYFLAKYDLYKHPFNSYEESWSVVADKTEGNQWSREVSSEQWQQELKDSYDYVLLFDAPDSFVKTYSNIFEDESAVASGCLYKVNKETGRLQICPIGY